MHPLNLRAYPKVKIQEELHRHCELSHEDESDASIDQQQHPLSAETARLSDIHADDMELPRQHPMTMAVIPDFDDDESQIEEMRPQVR